MEEMFVILFVPNGIKGYRLFVRTGTDIMALLITNFPRELLLCGTNKR